MRKNTRIHPPVYIGLDAVIGDNCKIQAFAYIPDNVAIGDGVFIGPHVVFTNDKYPPSDGAWKSGPQTIVEDYASIGANATILPGVKIGRGARVGAGAVVTKDVRPGVLVVGVPAREVKMEDEIKKRLDEIDKKIDIINKKLGIHDDNDVDWESDNPYEITPNIILKREVRNGKDY